MSASAKHAGPWLRCCSSTKLYEGAVCKKCGRVVTLEDLEQLGATGMTPGEGVAAFERAAEILKRVPRDPEYSYVKVSFGASNAATAFLQTLPEARTEVSDHGRTTIESVSVRICGVEFRAQADAVPKPIVAAPVIEAAPAPAPAPAPVLSLVPENQNGASDQFPGDELAPSHLVID